MSVDGRDLRVPVHPVHSVRRKGEVVVSAWTVADDGPTSGRTILFAGDLDNDSVPELRIRLLSQVDPRARHVTVDLAAVTFIGAEGFGLVHALRDAYGDVGVVLSLGRMSRLTERVFTILGWYDGDRPLEPTSGRDTKAALGDPTGEQPRAAHPSSPRSVTVEPEEVVQ
jgi:anti-anti-sigma factor